MQYEIAQANLQRSVAVLQEILQFALALAASFAQGLLN